MNNGVGLLRVLKQSALFFHPFINDLPDLIFLSIKWIYTYPFYRLYYKDYACKVPCEMPGM
jgi:hypothetical protein